MTKLVVFGGGRMGEALLTGLISHHWALPEELAVVEPSPERVEQLRANFPGVQISTDAIAADGAVLATKPGIVSDVAAALTRAGGASRVLSIAAGVTLARLESALPPKTPVIRAMPNTPALVGAGASAIAGGVAATDDDLTWAEELLGTVGLVVRVGEEKLDAVTGLSGSGPAYVFLVAEALIDAGVHAGLDRATARKLATQTLLGSARLLAETDQSASELRAAVTSPGGTTAEGLAVLEQAGVRAAIDGAVAAATARSAELGRD